MITLLHVIADVALMVLVFVYEWQRKDFEERQNEIEAKLYTLERTLNALSDVTMREKPARKSYRRLRRSLKKLKQEAEDEE